MTRWSLFALMVGAVGACAPAPKSDSSARAPVSVAATPQAAPPPRAVSRAVDLDRGPVAKWTKQVDGTFRGVASTYEVFADSNGALSFAPRDPATRRAGQPIRLGPATLRRASSPIDLGTRAPSIDAPRRLVRAADAVTSLLEHDSDGVEQSWRFERAPGGSGDLVASIAVRGARFSGKTPRGLHFVDATSGLGVAYGAATWIDASGARTPLETRWADDRIEVVVPDAVVASAAYPATLDPTIGAEIAVDAPLVAGASGRQDPVSVASNGTDYFAVWVDYRSGRAAVYGARVSAAGQVLDPSGVPIAILGGAPGVYYSLTAAVTGSAAGYFVAWTVTSDDETIPMGVFGKHVSSAGVVTDDQALPLAKTTNPQMVAVATSGTGYFVAWSAYQPPLGYNVIGVRVGADGKPLDATPIPVGASAEYEYDPSVDFDGTNYLVAWRGNAIYAARVSPATGLVDTTRIPVVAQSFPPSIAFDGTNHLVVWYQYNGATSYDVFGTRLSKQGTLVDATPFAISNAAGLEYLPSVAFDGTNYVVSWFDGSTVISARRVTPAATTPEAAFVVASGTGSRQRPRLASNGQSTLAAWTDFRDSTVSDADSWGARIAKTSNPSNMLDAAGFRVTSSSNAQTTPAIASDGTGYYAVWVDTRGTERAIYGARVSAQGNVLDANPTRITPPATTFAGTPRVAFGGGTYFVAWLTNAQTITLARVTPSTGAVEAPAAIYTSTTESISSMDLAFDGTNYLLVWSRYSSQTGLYGVAGLRVAPDKTVRDVGLNDAGVSGPIPNVLSPETPNKQRANPSIAFDGTNYFVAWETLSFQTGLSHIYGVRVGKDGRALDLETLLCNAFLKQRLPTVAADKAGGFLVAWQDYRSDAYNADLYGARVGADGQALDGATGFKIAAGPQDESLPRLVSVGQGSYALFYSDARGPKGYEIYAAWINAAGAVLDPTGVLVSGEAGDESNPAVAGLGDGNVAVAYQRLDPAPNFGNWRTRVRMIQSGAANGSACTDASQCFSRYCVDGFCCSTSCDGGCGVCNATPGTCTPRPRGPSPKCDAYQCDGTNLTCPDKCKDNSDCANQTICDTGIGRCVSAVTCVDIHTLRDVTGKTSDCAPYTCQGNACKTSCASVDDCIRPFVCDRGGRCVPPPSGSGDEGCNASGSEGGSVAWLAAVGALVASAMRRKRR